MRGLEVLVLFVGSGRGGRVLQLEEAETFVHSLTPCISHKYSCVLTAISTWIGLLTYQWLGGNWYLPLQGFQADIYAILACAYEIQLYGRTEKYVSIFSDSRAALKTLQASKTTSPLVQQCQKVLNDISTEHSVGLYWVPGHAGVRGNKIADKLARDGSVQKFVGPEPFLGGGP